MADEVEKIPFNTATGALFTPEEMAAKKEAAAATTATTTNTEEPVKTEDTTATKSEAADAGTTPDAVEAFFNSDLAEKYGIKNKDELFGILESITELKEERDQLKGRPPEPQFSNDKQKNIYEFLQTYDSLGDGMEMVARLNAIDPANMDGTAALKEAYILKNKDLTRDTAIKMFEKKEAKKYENSKKKEDYEDPQEWVDDNELLKIEKDRDIANARRSLIEHKEKLKTQAKEVKKEEKEEPAISPQALQRYTKDVEKFFEGFTSLKFSEDDGSNEITVKFTPDQLKGLKTAMIAHVSNPVVYKDGEIKDFDILESVNTFAWAMNHKQMTDLMLKQVNTRAQILKAEDIAKKDPDKKSGADAGDGAQLSGWTKLEADAKKKAEDKTRQQQQGPMRRTPLPAG